MTRITFVNQHDEVIGYGSKAEALSQGIIHRIVRIFVFNAKGELLIQRRSPQVAIPLRWDQSAAGHVDENEDYLTAAKRELAEESGITGIPLTEVSKQYTEETDDGITKKRFSTLYTARYDGFVKSNPQEVAETRWIGLSKLELWMKDNPDDFTHGFLQAYQAWKASFSS